jgi:hypothetical protein
VAVAVELGPSDKMHRKIAVLTALTVGLEFLVRLLARQLFTLAVAVDITSMGLLELLAEVVVVVWVRLVA